MSMSKRKLVIINLLFREDKGGSRIFRRFWWGDEVIIGRENFLKWANRINFDLKKESRFENGFGKTW